MRYLNHTLLLLALLGISCYACKKTGGTTPGGGGTTPPVTPGNGINFWITTGDQVSLLTKQNTAEGFVTTPNALPVITIDSTQTFQTIDGFGFTLTQGSAYVINQLPAATRSQLLTELFGNGADNISINYLRLAIGASDLSSSVYSYDDVPGDVSLASFNLGPDLTDLIPVLQQIVAINPSIKIVAAPWSAPVWMKDNNNSVGGSLLPAYYSVYANYFVKYINTMKTLGITIDAVTPQNEPLHAGNNPSLFMTSAQQANFIKNNLGPAFVTAGLSTKIIAWDHNCDNTTYPIDVLNDAAARVYVDGSAFHLYSGDISALTTVHNAYPSKNVYFTEQYTSSTGSFSGDLRWHLRNVIIGSVRNWSRNALEWNLANDAGFGPHTVGGCTVCKGALTIGSGAVARNVGYYIIGHASKFVPAGSVRIASNNSGNIQTAAFLRADGKKVLIVINDENSTQSFNIKFNNQWVVASLPAGAAATYVW